MNINIFIIFFFLDFFLDKIVNFLNKIFEIILILKMKYYNFLIIILLKIVIRVIFLLNRRNYWVKTKLNLKISKKKTGDVVHSLVVDTFVDHTTLLFILMISARVNSMILYKNLICIKYFSIAILWLISII